MVKNRSLKIHLFCASKQFRSETFEALPMILIIVQVDFLAKKIHQTSNHELIIHSDSVQFAFRPKTFDLPNSIRVCEWKLGSESDLYIFIENWKTFLVDRFFFGLKIETFFGSARKPLNSLRTFENICCPKPASLVNYRLHFYVAKQASINPDFIKLK